MCPGLTAAGLAGREGSSCRPRPPYPPPSPGPSGLPPACLQWEGSPGQAGPPLQLPGLGHNGRDMLLFLILFFYEKNQCQSTDPPRHQAGRAEPAAPLPDSEAQWRGAALPSLQDGAGPGLWSPSAPSHQRVHLTLECTTHPAVGKALRPRPLPLAAVLSLSPCRSHTHTKS